MENSSHNDLNKSLNPSQTRDAMCNLTGISTRHLLLNKVETTMLNSVNFIVIWITFKHESISKVHCTINTFC